MSRRIEEKKTPKLSEEQTQLKENTNGKLIFTEYHGRDCAMLIQENRLTFAQFFDNSKIGAIYLAKIKNVAKNIDACFIEISNQEICFLPLKDMKNPLIINRKYDGRVLQGDEILVQITKDAQKKKQATVTANISCANEFFVLSLGTNMIHYSAKIDQINRAKIQEKLTELNVLDSDFQMSDEFLSCFQPICNHFDLLIRTRAIQLEADKMNTAIEDVKQQMYHILKTASHAVCFTCVRKAALVNYLSVLSQSISDEGIDEIITDKESIWEHLNAPWEEHIFSNIPIKYYRDKSFPLHLLYGINSKMDMALQERIWLKSGGFLVIQPTEAMTVIDVNSSKFEPSGRSVEECALYINLEAAKEIALQLKLRNLSGIIMVDFINMKQNENNTKLIKMLREYVSNDPVKTVVVDMTKLGLIEITRKKIMKPLIEQLKE